MNNYGKTIGLITLFLFILFRLYIVSTESPRFDIYDSPRYFEFKLVDAFRLPVITGIYSIIENHIAIILIQNIFSSLAWIFIFISLSRFLKKNTTKILFFIFIIFFSFTQIVIFRDIYLASESLNLSLFLFITAAYFFDDSKKYKTFFLVFTLILVSGIKNQNAFFAIPILLYLFYKNYKNTLYSKAIKVSNTLLLSLASILCAYFISLSLSDTTISSLNTAAHVNFRIWSDEAWKKQLLDTRYPPELRTIWRDFYTYNRGIPPSEAVAQEAIFKEWWEQQNGNSFLIEFTLKNLDYLLLGPIHLPILNDKLDYSHTITYGIAHDPNYHNKVGTFTSLAEILWPTSRLNSYLFIAILLSFIGISLLYLSNNKAHHEVTLKISVTLIVVISWSLLSWYVASKIGIDILRNSEILSIYLRLFGIYLVLLLYDSLKFDEQKSILHISKLRKFFENKFKKYFLKNAISTFNNTLYGSDVIK